ncbi:MAG: response regulator [Methanomicrobiales archaeon]|nr:response regulator [Methanomicrobiales archaeon]MDI6875219.1 response regulator [Methanomicrobiales archaeon]
MYTILVVDDSPFIVDVFVTMLERGGYRAIASYSGQEALDILKEVTPDIILLDIMMEPMDGWETLERIKSNPNCHDIPVLMLTAKQLTPDEAQEYGPYIEDYVLKPITHRELYDTIEHVLNRRKAIRLDVEAARKAGLDHHVIEEYASLNKNVDVNKRLLKILETTYDVHDPKIKVSEKISNAIKTMALSIRSQEERLEMLRADLGRVLEKR